MLTNLYNLILGFSKNILAALSILGDAWSLVLISIVLGVVLVLIYGKISFQKKVAEVKRKIFGNIIESVIYRHDLKIALKAQLGALVSALKYAGLAIPPLLILAIPAIFILGQLYPVYAVRALKNNEQTIVTATLNKEASDRLNSISLESKDVKEVLPPIRISSKSEISWRITAQGETGLLTIKADEKSFNINLNDKNIWRDSGFENILYAWFTGSYALDSDSSKIFSSITVSYPEKSINWLGIKWNWLILFFIVSLIAGLFSAKLAKIEI
jgi:hypothetical protein